jgi:hypothetical protein
MSNCRKDRQLLFIGPQSELAAGFAKMKAPPAGKFKSLARDLFAGLLELSRDFFQFRKIGNDKTPRLDARSFFRSEKAASHLDVIPRVTE